MSNYPIHKIDRFDTRAWLEDSGIPYSTEGRNISNGWIGVACYFCGDNSTHLGIGPNNQINCWRCGTKGDIIKLIRIVNNCGFSDALAILEEYQDYTIKQLKQDILTRSGETIVPPEAHIAFPPLYLDYLWNRRFDPDIIIPKYGLKAFPNFGNYSWRIYIPCIFNKSVVNFTTLSVVDKRSKYKHCPNEKAIIPMKHCLYNLDNVYKRIIIVEGVTDVWRMGDGTIATMGIQFTTAQIKLIINKRPEIVHIMFDSDLSAQRQAKKLAETLSNLFINTNLITLPKGDPADLTDEEAQALRKELL